MDCREFLLRYSDYDDSLIPPHEAARFRAHMAECASCARYDRVLRKGRMVARQLPRIEPADDFVPRLRRRLLRGAPRRSSLPGVRLAAGLAAATIVMAVAAAVMLESATGAAPAPGWSARAAPSSAVPEATGGQAVKSGPIRRRVVTLPPVDRAEPRAWEAREVAPPRTASYSPLETGPPLYRVASSSPIQRTSGRALD